VLTTKLSPTKGNKFRKPCRLRNLPISSGLKNQKILVTAASQGIGFGVAKAFLEEGARVVINSSNEEKLKAAKQKLSSFGEVHHVAGYRQPRGFRGFKAWRY
jgi:FlaA1/EpsC-like NDP-sugar epimerase